MQIQQKIECKIQMETPGCTYMNVCPITDEV